MRYVDRRLDTWHLADAEVQVRYVGPIDGPYHFVASCDSPRFRAENTDIEALRLDVTARVTAGSPNTPSAWRPKLLVIVGEPSALFLRLRDGADLDIACLGSVGLGFLAFEFEESTPGAPLWRRPAPKAKAGKQPAASKIHAGSPVDLLHKSEQTVAVVVDDTPAVRRHLTAAARRLGSIAGRLRAWVRSANSAQQLEDGELLRLIESFARGVSE